MWMRFIENKQKGEDWLLRVQASLTGSLDNIRTSYGLWGPDQKKMLDVWLSPNDPFVKSRSQEPDFYSGQTDEQRELRLKELLESSKIQS